jgi:hypothetical protein
MLPARRGDGGQSCRGVAQRVGTGDDVHTGGCSDTEGLPPYLEVATVHPVVTPEARRSWEAQRC